MTKRREVRPGGRSPAAQATPKGSAAATPAAGIRVIFRWFWPATRHYRGRLFASLLLVAIGPLLDTAQVWMFKLLIDDVLIPRDFHAFPAIAAGYIGIGLAQGIASILHLAVLVHGRHRSFQPSSAGWAELVIGVVLAVAAAVV
ncbi:MAG: hypothetical protein ACRDRO_30960, partial [Pseudonocardiaceae bacterium]